MKMKYVLLSSASYKLLVEVLLPALLKGGFSVIYNLLSYSKKNYIVFKQKLTNWRNSNNFQKFFRKKVFFWERGKIHLFTLLLEVVPALKILFSPLFIYVCFLCVCVFFEATLCTRPSLTLVILAYIPKWQNQILFI